MPLFKIVSNIDVSDRELFIKKASKEIALILGKSEKYVMVIFHPNSSLIFSTNEEPALYIELKSIGLTGEKTGDITMKIMEFLEKETGVSKSRMFIEFTDVQCNLWGWNGDTM
ncbi:MAG: hypothetical protein IH598_13785 [Bacteroidales bacterium]|nr:hypothetical protein [Bacteroidales bacterium]